MKYLCRKLKIKKWKGLSKLLKTKWKTEKEEFRVAQMKKKEIETTNHGNDTKPEKEK